MQEKVWAFINLTLSRGLRAPAFLEEVMKKYLWYSPRMDFIFISHRRMNGKLKTPMKHENVIVDQIYYIGEL